MYFTLGGMMSSIAIGAKIGAAIGGIFGTVYGGYTGYQKTGNILTFDILKYGLLGVVGGGIIGGVSGLAIYLAPQLFHMFKPVLQQGWKAFVQKCANPGGHSTTEHCFQMGLVCGFGVGLYDPDFMIEIKALGGTSTALSSDILVRGIVARRAYWAPPKSVLRPILHLLSKYVQSITYLTTSFLVGFSLGYPIGAGIGIGIRYISNSISDDFDAIFNEE
jgi:hypothetical protein